MSTLTPTAQDAVNKVNRRAYSPAELAAALGCTRQHIQNLIARGELPSFKLGSRRFIPAHVLDDLEARANGGANDVA